MCYDLVMINFQNRITKLRARLKVILEENYGNVNLQLAHALEINPKILTSFLTNNEYKISAATYNKIIKKMTQSGILFQEASFEHMADILQIYEGDPFFSYPVTYEKEEIDRIHLAQTFIMGGEEDVFKKNCRYYAALDSLKSDKRINGLVSAVRNEYTNSIEKLDTLSTYNEVFKKLTGTYKIHFYSIDLPEYLWNEKDQTECHFYFAVLNEFHRIKNKIYDDLLPEEKTFFEKHNYVPLKRGFRAILNENFPATMAESKRPKK